MEQEHNARIPAKMKLQVTGEKNALDMFLSYQILLNCVPFARTIFLGFRT